MMIQSPPSVDPPPPIDSSSSLHSLKLSVFLVLLTILITLFITIFIYFLIRRLPCSRFLDFRRLRHLFVPVRARGQATTPPALFSQFPRGLHQRLARLEPDMSSLPLSSLCLRRRRYYNDGEFGGKCSSRWFQELAEGSLTWYIIACTVL